MLATEPVRFPDALREGARGGVPTRALVVGAHAPHVLEGVRRAVGEDWIEPVLIGPPDGIQHAADKIGWDPVGIETLPAEGEAEMAAAATRAAPSCGMVIKGHIHTSALLGALLRKEAGVRTGGGLAHVFYLTHPDSPRGLAVADGALNIAPDLEMRKQILRLLAGLLRILGTPRPRIAILAATEEVAPQMPVTLEAKALADWAEEEGLEAEVHGPLALDAALSPVAARIKGIESPVAGAADGLLVPDIETGNAVVKTLIWCRAACAAGIVLGGRIPVLVPSRSDPPEARLAATALARIVARHGDSGS